MDVVAPVTLTVFVLSTSVGYRAVKPHNNVHGNSDASLSAS